MSGVGERTEADKVGIEAGIGLWPFGEWQVSRVPYIRRKAYHATSRFATNSKAAWEVVFCTYGAIIRRSRQT